MEEALVVGLYWFPTARLEPDRRLPHVDMSVVLGGGVSVDIHGIGGGGTYVGQYIYIWPR